MYSKTTYWVLDIEGNKTAICLDKYVADTLQDNLPNVHQWIGGCFREISARYPNYSRRRKGDMVRRLAAVEAGKDPGYSQRIIDSI